MRVRVPVWNITSAVNPEAEIWPVRTYSDLIGPARTRPSQKKIPPSEDPIVLCNLCSHPVPGKKKFPPKLSSSNHRENGLRQEHDRLFNRWPRSMTRARRMPGISSIHWALLGIGGVFHRIASAWWEPTINKRPKQDASSAIDRSDEWCVFQRYHRVKYSVPSSLGHTGSGLRESLNSFSFRDWP